MFCAGRPRRIANCRIAVAAVDRWMAGPPEDQRPPSRREAVRQLLDETLALTAITQKG
jgi:hypothetical protein